ncbi:hypothetical protein OBBRIDRAFT_755122 [Obba rivulosa]|uniref:Sde2 N-terminal ubiquitin domain-containing protein n=1 Tax=Obba rivulosa TaxID=1052685 RepID=A0A8E2ATI1_9APHY|nr:hypothetical protein OBBRIDRAFT_755122 [Obba rivulosa]
MTTSVLISTFPPFPTLAFSAPGNITIADLYNILGERYPNLPSDLILSPHRGVAPSPSVSLSSLCAERSEDAGVPLVSLRLVPRLLGGKGGFGSQLRAAGGRMSSQKTSNNDSCRDLSGRRLSTIKEAKRLAEYIESEPARKQAAHEAKRAKLEALEKKLGIADGAGPSEPLAGKKHRFDDTEYLEQKEEIVENVKSAVAAGLLKKRKKAKTTHSPPAETEKKEQPSVVETAIATASTVGSAVAAATSATTNAATSMSEKILESPVAASVTVAASAAAGMASA